MIKNIRRLFRSSRTPTIEDQRFSTLVSMLGEINHRLDHISQSSARVERVADGSELKSLTSDITAIMQRQLEASYPSLAMPNELNRV